MPLNRLLEDFYSKTGIVFTDKHENVKSKIQRFYAREGYESLERFVDALSRDKMLYERFINLLTVSETYFFREMTQIKLFLETVESKKNSPIKILCAPCASGEEPYTLLIALHEAGFSLDKISLYGIDINSDEIAKAEAACFAPRRLHKLSQAEITAYFRPKENNFVLKEAIRKHAQFSQMNIFDTWPAQLNGFDAIFSRNMLIYFDEKAKRRSEEIFYEKLSPGGTLFLGHADIIPNSVGLKKETRNGISYYKKEG